MKILCTLILTAMFGQLIMAAPAFADCVKIRSLLTVLGITIGIATVSNQRPYGRVTMLESLKSMLAALSVERSSPRFLFAPPMGKRYSTRKSTQPPGIRSFYRKRFVG
jgi:hypothetical protein